MFITLMFTNPDYSTTALNIDPDDLHVSIYKNVADFVDEAFEQIKALDACIAARAFPFYEGRISLIHEKLQKCEELIRDHAFDSFIEYIIEKCEANDFHDCDPWKHYVEDACLRLNCAPLETYYLDILLAVSREMFP